MEQLLRLYDVVHTEKKLTLVFEYMDSDLKKFLDSYGGDIDILTVKVTYMYKERERFSLYLTRK